MSDKVPTDWAAVRAFVYERDGYKCRYCIRTTSLTLDHLVPASLFPKNSHSRNSTSNLATACSFCNSLKADSYLHGCCFVSALTLYHPEVPLDRGKRAVKKIVAIIEAHNRAAEKAPTITLTSGKVRRQRIYVPPPKFEPMRTSIGELTGWVTTSGV